MTVNFDEVRLPAGLALGARGGPERRTEIVTLGSGFEHRNQLWAQSRRRWNVGYGVKKLSDLEQILAFFEQRRGRMRGFRFSDRIDASSAAAGAAIGPADQAIGTGDGAAASFQLRKTYGAGASSYVRIIHKPVAETLRVAVDGVEKSVGSHVTLDPATGTITFAGGHIPTNGALVTAGFAFDVPVRFDTDFLEIDAAAFAAGAVPDIPIVEIRL